MMIRRGWRTGALVLATVWLTGCAGTGAQLTQSGFLQDYARLQPRDDATVAWLNPSTRPFGERPLVVEPVVIREQQVEGEVISLADNRYSNLRVWLRDAVEARLKAAGYTVADEPAPDATRIRLAVTGLMHTPSSLRILEMLPMGALLAGAKAVTGNRNDDVVMFVELQVRDPRGEVLIEGVQRVNGVAMSPRELAGITPRQVQAQADVFALRLADSLQRFDRAHANGTLPVAGNARLATSARP